MLIQGVGTERTTLYEGLAESIAHLIEAGTFREGQKIPSIRTMSRQFGVSVNTVREAYWVLETQRLLEGRPQSGYFVRRAPPKAPGPRVSEVPFQNPHEVVPCSLIEVFDTEGQFPYRGLSLVKGTPNFELLPIARLHGYLGAVARELGERAADYDGPRGLLQLREALAQHALEAGVLLSPDDLLVTTGALHSVSLAVQFFCRPGDTVAIESPTYSEFLKLFRGMGVKVLEIPSSPRDGMSLEVLEWALERHDVKAVITVPSFNNPGGFLMPEARKRALVELLASREIPLIEDDAYGDLTALERRPPACKSFDTQGLVVYCSSVSKTLAPGYRIGWVAGGRWHEDLVEWKRLLATAASLPAQWAVARFLKEGNYARHLRTLGRRLANQVAAAVETVVSSFPEGTRLEHPVGGLFLWIVLPERVNAEALYARSAPEGVYFRPGVVFSASGKYQNQLRLSIGTWNEDVRAAVVRLGEHARALAKD